MCELTIRDFPTFSRLIRPILDPIQAVLRLFGILFETRDNRFVIPDLLLERFLRLGIVECGLLNRAYPVNADTRYM